MSEKLTFSWRDVARAAKLGFSAKKIGLMVLGFFVAAIIYAIIEYIALLVSGLSIREIWGYYRFIPFPSMADLTDIGEVLHVVALIVAAIVMMLTGVAVSKVTYEQLRGDEFYEMSKAIKFALKEGRASVFAPITLILIIIAILIMGIILGLIGKIPYLGEIFLLLASIPAFFGVLLIVYLVFSFILSIFISAPIVATTKSDTFDTLFEIFSTLNSQVWRFILYELILGVVGFVTVSIWAFSVGRALWIAESVLSHPWLMGTKYLTLERIAHYYLSVPPFFKFPSAAYAWLTTLGVGSITAPPAFLPHANIVMQVVGFIFGIMLYAIVFMVLGYAGAIGWSGNTLIYIVLTKKKDDIDLLERKEETEISFEEEEEEKEKAEESEGEKEAEKTEPEKKEQQLSEKKQNSDKEDKE